jgi:hypothetical protein
MGRSVLLTIGLRKPKRVDMGKSTDKNESDFCFFQGAGRDDGSIASNGVPGLPQFK